MTNIFIIHGSHGHPQENWFPWIKIELEKLGHQVFVPQFPTPEEQALENWLQVIEQYKERINEKTIFIGHSLGATFILHLLQKYKIQAAFLVAGFISKLNNEFDQLNKTFTDTKFNWPKIQAICPYFKIYHADNDPYIKLEKGQQLATKLNTKLTIVKNAGHFNAAAGYDKFNLLLKDIINIPDAHTHDHPQQ